MRHRITHPRASCDVISPSEHRGGGQNPEISPEFHLAEPACYFFEGVRCCARSYGRPARVETMTSLVPSESGREGKGLGCRRLASMTQTFLSPCSNLVLMQITRNITSEVPCSPTRPCGVLYRRTKGHTMFSPINITLNRVFTIGRRSEPRRLYRTRAEWICNRGMTETDV